MTAMECALSAEPGHGFGEALKRRWPCAELVLFCAALVSDPFKYGREVKDAARLGHCHSPQSPQCQCESTGTHMPPLHCSGVGIGQKGGDVSSGMHDACAATSSEVLDAHIARLACTSVGRSHNTRTRLNCTTSSKLTAYTSLSHGAKTCVLFTPQIKLRVKNNFSAAIIDDNFSHHRDGEISNPRTDSISICMQGHLLEPDRKYPASIMSWKHHTTGYQSLHRMIRR
jgi:hypothetical protein